MGKRGGGGGGGRRQGLSPVTGNKMIMRSKELPGCSVSTNCKYLAT